MSKNKEGSGVFVLKRFNKSEENIVNEFTSILHNYTKLNQKGRVDQKLQAKEISNLADWKEFIKFYFEAYDLALERNN